MSDTRLLDRLIRVRRVRSRLALVVLSRSQARQLAESALLERVRALLGQGSRAPGPVAANAGASRVTADAMLGRLADDVGRRLAETVLEKRALAEALGRARAAVDAAVERLAEREA